MAPDAESAELWLLRERPCGAPGQDKPKPHGISGPATMSLDELAQWAHRRPELNDSHMSARSRALG